METFIVRVQPTDKGRNRGLHGFVESVGARQAPRTFQSEGELLVLLRDLLEIAQHVNPLQPAERDHPMRSQP